MPLRFIGVDPESAVGESPTVWIHEETRELVIQGWKADHELEAQCAGTEIPGHAREIPAHEAVVRIPARLVPILREACDVIERFELR